MAQLRGDPQQGPVYELLSIMLSGDVQSFQAFAGANSGVFEAVGSSLPEALLKMRLMALLGLASRAATVSYQDIQARTHRRPPRPQPVHPNLDFFLFLHSTVLCTLSGGRAARKGLDHGRHDQGGGAHRGCGRTRGLAAERGERGA